MNGGVKVSAETKTSDGVTLIATGRRFVKDKAVAVELGLEPKYDYTARNVEFTANVNTSAEYSATATLKDVGTKGTKIGLTATSNAKGVSYKASTSFKNDNVAVKLAGTLALDRPIVLDGSIVGAYEKRFFAGLSGNFTAASGDKAAVLLGGAKVGIEQGDVQAHLSGTLTEKNLLLGVGWFQKVSNALKVGASILVDGKQVAGPAGTLGSEYKFDNLSSLKTKIGVQYPSDGTKPWEARLGVGLKQALSANVTATIAADVNVRQVLGTNAGPDHSFGLEVKLV